MGPFAKAKAELFGNYSPHVTLRFTSSVCDGLSRLATDAVCTPGCSSSGCTDYKPGDVQKAVTGANLVVVALGLGTKFESEGNDRRNLDLPGDQLQILKDAVSWGE